MAGRHPEIVGYSAFRLVGKGGYSEVYEATQDAFDRRVAVKVITVDFDDDDLKRRFRAECHALGKVARHPNVVDVYDSGETADQQPYVAMEFCAGGSLADAASSASGSLPLGWLVDTVIKVADALRHAHAHGIVHRDIKPANIMLHDNGEPVVVDFGIATLEGLETGTMTASVFTPAHAAPERFDMQAGDGQTDVYSLASTLFALIEGHAPYERPDGNSIAAIVRRMVTEDVPPMARRDIPPSLRHAVETGLAKEPHNRPDMATFAEELRTARRELKAMEGVALGTWTAPETVPGDSSAAVPPTPAPQTGTFQPYTPQPHTPEPHTPTPQPQSGQYLGTLESGGLAPAPSDGDRRSIGTGVKVAIAAVAVALVAGLGGVVLLLVNRGGGSTSTSTAPASKTPALVVRNPQKVWSQKTNWTYADISDDGLLVAWADTAGTVKTARIDSKTSTTVKASAGAEVLSLTGDGRLLAVGYPGTTVDLFNPVTGARLGTMTAPGQLRSIAFAESGHTLLTTGHDGSVGVFDADTKKLTTKIPIVKASVDDVVVANMSLDGAYVVAGRAGQPFDIYRADTGKKIGTCPGTAQDEDGLLWSQSDHLVIFDRERGKFAGCSVSTEGTSVVATELKALTRAYAGAKDQPSWAASPSTGIRAGSLLFVAVGKNLDLWNVTGDVGRIGTVGAPSGVTPAALRRVYVSRTGRLAAVSTDSGVYAYDFESPSGSTVAYVIKGTGYLFGYVIEDQQVMYAGTADELSAWQLPG